MSSNSDVLPYSLFSTWVEQSSVKGNIDDGIVIPLGVDADTGVITSIALGDHTPHLLVMAKSYSMGTLIVRNILHSVCSMYSPDEIEFCMVDVKGVEFSMYSGDLSLPHIAYGNDFPIATSVLPAFIGNLMTEMNLRLKQFRNEGVKNIREYNSKASAENKMSRIVILVNRLEFSNLSVQESESIFKSIMHYIRLGRAAGFHLVLVTPHSLPELPYYFLDNFTLSITDTTDAGRSLEKGLVILETVDSRRFPIKIPFITSQDILHSTREIQAKYSDTTNNLRFAITADIEPTSDLLDSSNIGLNLIIGEYGGGTKTRLGEIAAQCVNTETDVLVVCGETPTSEFFTDKIVPHLGETGFKRDINVLRLKRGNTHGEVIKFIVETGSSVILLESCEIGTDHIRSLIDKVARHCNKIVYASLCQLSDDSESRIVSHDNYKPNYGGNDNDINENPIQIQHL